MDASELKINGIPAKFIPYIKARVETFHPAYFAMSMATGIISIGCHFLGMNGAAEFLFWLNIPVYCGLWAVTIFRACFFSKSFFSDWSSHHRGPGFFTTVAATCVLGSQFVILLDNSPIGYGLWWLGMVLWCICTYAIFVLLSIRDNKPSLADGINGGWLVAVVATQSVCVLGCRVLPGRFMNLDMVFFFLASLWLCAGMLYIWMISLIFYRYMFFKFAPEDLMPPYWINMGAVAISTLAGASLITAASNSPLLISLLPFMKGMTLMYWATATWWIPMLLILGFWRHSVRHLRFTYNPLYWGLVFPLGMYSVCTFWMAKIFGLDFLVWIAKGFIVIALIAWLLTFFAMVTRLLYLIYWSCAQVRWIANYFNSKTIMEEHND